MANHSASVIAVFDIGKTNKKVFLINEDYEMLWEQEEKLTETVDEDGYPCEDIQQLTQWVQRRFNEIMSYDRFQVRAVNVSTYGASWVLVDRQGKPVAPLYNYLKPYPEELLQTFHARYGDRADFARSTASPPLGNLNSGLQLYRLKHQRPDIFRNTQYALHLPQYISSLLTGRYYSDMTSIGCHTGLWNFKDNLYHDWTQQEGIREKLAPIFPSNQAMNIHWQNHPLSAGVGLHDSSAALIPYLINDRDPFVLISTGTWCISLNPFNETPLTDYELQHDCLQYLEYRGRPVKASRLFAGDEHERETRRIAAHFLLKEDFYRQLPFSQERITENKGMQETATGSRMAQIGPSGFSGRDLGQFPDAAGAYETLMADIVGQQVFSTSLVLKNSQVRTLYVDGGFARNPFYMHLLANAFPQLQVLAAEVSQATALGTALAIHAAWNRSAIPADLITCQAFPPISADPRKQ